MLVMSWVGTLWPEGVSYSSVLVLQLLALCLADGFQASCLAAGDGDCKQVSRHSLLSTHLVKVVLNVQNFLRQESQATEQHRWGFMDYCQMEQPGARDA